MEVARRKEQPTNSTLLSQLQKRASETPPRGNFHVSISEWFPSLRVAGTDTPESQWLRIAPVAMDSLT